MTNRASLQDIADQLGITKMTVSRYFRTPEKVAPATREKIAQAVKQSGYIHNRAPALMSKALSRTVGVVIPSLSNQVFSALVDGIETITNAEAFDILLAHSGYDPHIEERKIEMLLSYQVDGLILCETEHTERTRTMLKQAGIPVVECMELPESPLDMVVGLDHKAAAFDAVSRMIKSNKRRIVYLAARLDRRTMLRQQGYEQAMWEAGLTPQIVATPFQSSFSQGGSLLKQALDTFDRLDGIFCTNDDLAVGAMQFCQNAGIRVPDDLAVMGYNGLDIGLTMQPPLTSVVTPRQAIGIKSARLIIDVINGKPRKEKLFDLGFSYTDGHSLG
ncbi:substrate-binding domain-containing protein [Alteromonas lipolytica]|uniref:Transcriptional regulator n=1 Tax=Alteromonas lipolytica TaxID=1856405 RepID=A0A1E8FIQ4_9ALTE|nr:substrate-binding domain-containing protein [Alteromonas lipolytica]OFI35821.1 transcriptional regulator [Alteromonas lipolytica]GGF81116.1 transcriptional regulator [Alteromonas lipolytica]